MVSRRKILIQTVAIFSLTLNLKSDESLRLLEDDGEMSVSWNTLEGRTYFIQWSYDMKSWTPFPIIESGDGETRDLGVDTDDGKNGFFRLLFTDQETDDPYNDDFDGDGISNWDEIKNGGSLTNPLAFSSDSSGVSDFNLDKDQDGLGNGAELALGIDSNSPDSDEDGLLDGREVSLGHNPTWQDHPDVQIELY